MEWQQLFISFSHVYDITLNKESARISQRTDSMFIVKTNQLIMYREIIDFYCKNHNK
jgi:hypothetical protein